VGAFMYVIEGPERGFDSIPTSVYWAIVTLTTVGYGDISPQTPLGRTLAAALMILGYGVIAVPTGIVTTELARAGSRREAAQRRAAERRICGDCGLSGHGEDAKYCRRCGAALPERSSG
jgi:voltage-gated potassium channel